MTLRQHLGAMALLAAATLTACGTVLAQATIKIGAPLPMTGALSPEGQRLKQGHDLWAEAVNKAGGIQAGSTRYKVELVYADYQSNTPRAVQLADKLITQDKVDYIFAPFGSGATKAVSAVTEKNEVPNIAATASSVEVFNQGHKYIFGLFTPNDSLTEPLADLAKARLPAGARVAVLARNDLFPSALAAELEKSAKKRGFEIVYSGKYAIGALDHSGALVQVKAARPDWLFVSGYTNDMILVRKQMQDAGLAAGMLTMVIGPSYREFTESIGPLAENVSSAVWWHPVANYSGQDVFGSTEKYVTAFRQKYGSDPDYANAVGSLAGVVLQAAIEKAASTDRKAVREQLARMDLKTFFGPVAFDRHGMVNSYVPPVFQIQSGRSVVVYPASIATGSLK
ncbi:amino acid ABC transporter substrate-binding protein [Alicycliphilus denitrificans]|uniref:ABC transporter substrate-binding protein n=1 Tax=Alicycliphilus denitrificans TaxID=179636 RepID=A0A420KEW3_9BURK|nr:amino acid ABC transporter substrate-binding protein [Alicycliphilus denitrificans]RKJ98479.1 ABC transporter substrate-binding protein [Alicycliphilus denitrificans]